MRATQYPIGPSKLAARTRKLIGELMEEQGLSAKRLSALSGVDDNAIGRILRSQMVPSLDVTDRLFAGLGYEVTIEITPNPDLVRQPAKGSTST